MKSKNKAFVLVSLMVLVGLIRIISNGYSTSDITYSFENDNLYNSTAPSYYTGRNYRDYSEYTGHYNATYSFIGETGLKGTDISFVGTNLSHHSEVVSNIYGHDEVLRYYDDDGSSDFYSEEFEFSVLDGSVELWVNIVDTSNQIRLAFQDVGAVCFYVRWNIDKIHASAIPIEDIYDNQWARVKVEWFNDDTWDLYMNEILINEGKAMDVGMTNGINRLRLIDYQNNPLNFIYLDAIGYSWDGYNATYSFTDDVDGSVPIGWDDTSGGTTSATITNNLNNHYKILELSDTDAGDDAIIDKSITQELNSTVEFWITKDAVGGDTNANLYLYEGIFGGGTIRVQLLFQDNDIDYHDGSQKSIKDNYLIANIFTHIKLILDDSTNTFDCYIDGILEGDDLGYRSNSVLGVDMLRFSTDTGDTGYSYFIDAIGFSWDDYYGVGDNLKHYSIGDDMFPYLDESSEKFEVDKYEFAFEGWEDLYEVGEDVFSNWTEIEGGGDTVNIASDPLDNADRRVSIFHSAPVGDDVGLEKEFFIQSGIVNLSWCVEFDDVGSMSEFRTKVYSYDKTLVANIFIENGFLKDGGDWLTGGVFTTGEVYEFFLYINYNDGIRWLRYYTDGVYQNIFNKSVDSSKDGLGEIEFFIDSNVGDDMELYLDYVGVYINGSSISEEFGHRKIRYIYLEDDSLNWEFKEFNLFSFNAIGNLSFWITEPSYIMGVGTIENVVPFGYYDSNEIYNQYDLTFDGNSWIYVPYLWIGFYNDVLLNSISIDGVKLTEDGHEYPLDFTHGNVDIDESYFYVLGDKLYYSITYNDTDLEYIQASFNILNRLGENRSARYYSDTNGNYAEFRLKYTDSTVSGQKLQTSYYISNLILNQEKELDYFQLLITDDDKMSVGTTTGRMSGIVLQWLPNISITITTLNLLGMITVLIIIIIPTLVISRKLGSKTIIPMVFLMSLLCVATELIPIWLFVVITISLGSFYIVGSKMNRGGM